MKLSIAACLAFALACGSLPAFAQTQPLFGEPAQPIQPYSQPAPAPLEGAPATTPPAVQPPSGPPQSSAPAAQSSSYALGAGDHVRVTVFGEPDLTGDYIIGAQGTIAYALVGEVELAGLRTDQAAAAIADRLRGSFLHDPRVSVAVLAYRPFYILGEVQRPGAYPYSPDLSIMGAIATAGGFTYRANRRAAFISEPRGRERRVMLNGAVQIRPGDTIRVTERWF